MGQQKQYDDTDKGALFRNERKDTDNHPDYKGSINVGGVDHWISAWIKKSKKGQVYMSLSVTPKERVHANGIEKAREALNKGLPADLNDCEDVPF